MSENPRVLFIPTEERKLDTHRVHVLRTIMAMNAAREQGACFNIHATCARTDTSQSNAQNTQATHAEQQKRKATQRVMELPTSKRKNRKRMASTFPADFRHDQCCPTPINIDWLNDLLSGYDQQKHLYIIEGLRNGFNLQRDTHLTSQAQVTSIPKNHASALRHPDIVKKKLLDEVAVGHEHWMRLVHGVCIGGCWEFDRCHSHTVLHT